jgi:hypothetical protein
MRTLFGTGLLLLIEVSVASAPPQLHTESIGSQNMTVLLADCQVAPR